MRALPAAGFIASLALVFAVSARLLPTGDGDQGRHIHVLSRLDEHTRGSRESGNTVPTFLALPGLLGALPAAAALPEAGTEAPAPPAYTTTDIKPINQIELQKGICAASLSLLVRQQFPGSYDDMSDDALEKTVLKKRPEYKDRLCVLPVWVNAAPSEIVKYEVEPASRLTGGRRFLWAGIITALFGAVSFAAWQLKN